MAHVIKSIMKKGAIQVVTLIVNITIITDKIRINPIISIIFDDLRFIL